MYAIIKTGGKQFRVAEGDLIDVELLDLDNGSTIDFTEVLFFHDGKNPVAGTPFVSDCTVSAELLGTVAGPKVESMKYRPSHHEYRTFGHKQKYSRLRIKSIGKHQKKKGGK